jgi:hypothetical protein
MVRYGLIFILAAIACQAGGRPERGQLPVIDNGRQDGATFTTIPGVTAANRGNPGRPGALVVGVADELFSLAIEPRFK